MSLNYYNPYERYRQRFWERMGGILLFLTIMGVCLVLGFWLGRQASAQKIAYLQDQVKQEQQAREELQNSVTGIRADAQTATMRLTQLQETYAENVPEGPVSEIITLVRKQVDEGMDPQRLEFLIRSARPPRNCTEPETRRFVISTPANTAPESTINIAEGGLIIKGAGASARNAKGEPEAWYDPSKNVALEFIPADGKAEKKAGIMPLHHSVVVGAKEYRFTIEEGARSFAKVTFDSCDYP